MDYTAMFRGNNHKNETSKQALTDASGRINESNSHPAATPVATGKECAVLNDDSVQYALSRLHAMSMNRKAGALAAAVLQQEDVSRPAAAVINDILDEVIDVSNSHAILPVQYSSTITAGFSSFSVHNSSSDRSAAGRSAAPKWSKI